VLEEEFVRLVHEFVIGGEFYFGFWAVAGTVESKGRLHRDFYIAFEVRVFGVRGKASFAFCPEWFGCPGKELCRK
jgi:hypothetical protein